MSSRAYQLQGAIELFRWRESEGISQTEAAARCGTDLPKYNAWENGRARPGLDGAVRIEEITKGAVRVKSWTVAVADRDWAKAERERHAS